MHHLPALAAQENRPRHAPPGFAQCMKRTKGHTYSATAPACEQHKAVTQEQAQARAEWINKGVGQ